MAAFWSSIADQAQSMIALEIIAVVTAIAYLLLAVRQNIWCWPTSVTVRPAAAASSS